MWFEVVETTDLEDGRTGWSISSMTAGTAVAWLALGMELGASTPSAKDGLTMPRGTCWVDALETLGGSACEAKPSTPPEVIAFN